MNEYHTANQKMS